MGEHERTWIAEPEIGTVLGAEELEAIQAALYNRRQSLSWGEEVGAFEQDFAAYCGVQHAIAVSSCTAALDLCAQALRLGPGDEVIATPQSFWSTIRALVARGGKIRFADIEPNTLNLDCRTIEQLVTKQTKAIYAVHYGGNPADLDCLRMRLVRIVKSMDATPKERDRRYFVTDPVVAFWYRFVQPNLSSVAQGFGPEVWKHQIAPKLDEFMGVAFEEICREHARRFSQENCSAPAQEIGRIWHADYDIDIAGKLLDGTMIYGECKWWRELVGENILDELIERASRTNYGRDNPKRQFVLYARTGFTPALQRRATNQPGIVLHTPRTMLRALKTSTKATKRKTRSHR